MLIAFAFITPGTVMCRSATRALLVLAVTFFAAGYAPLLPPLATVLGTNALILYAEVVLLSGIRAFVERAEASTDRFNLWIVAATLPLFWHWGIIVPDGSLRSIVFSIASAFISGRTAWHLFSHMRRKPFNWAAANFTVICSIIAVWMLIRVVILYLAPIPLDPATKGTNPTSWLTVFGYIIVTATLVISIIWFETKKLRTATSAPLQDAFSEAHSGNSILIWSVVSIFCFAIVSEIAIAYQAIYKDEQEHLARTSSITTQSLVGRVQEVIGQADTLARSVRGYYETTHSIAKTQAFISEIGFDRKVMEDVYLLNKSGEVLIPATDSGKGFSMLERDYFLHHQATSEDDLFIASVQIGKITGKKQFRITRRLTDEQGNFAGVIVIPIEPSGLSGEFQKMLSTSDSVATLLGIRDRKIRVRAPSLADEQWHTTVDSPVWELLKEAKTGDYTNKSAIDNIERRFRFQQVGELPLVVVTGFTESDVRSATMQRIRPFAAGVVLMICLVIVLAMILTLVLSQRDEQDRFLGMLSHELKTPLATISMALGNMQLPNFINQPIRRSITAMTDVIERCLQADRLSNNRITPSLHPCNLKQILLSVGDACADPVAVDINVDDMPDGFRSDPQLIQTIVSNLIDNAIKYKSENSPVNCTATRLTVHGRQGISIQVRNTPGPAGLPSPDKVFEKYYRSPKAKGQTGSGLGLYISQGFAKKLGGTLRYTNNNNQACFELWIPS